MDDPHHGPFAREPQIEDLARICRALNEAGARYILIGGFAVIAHGGVRTTKDIDFLVDAAPDNIARVTLIRTKNTVRPSDAADRRYLEERLRAERGEP